MNRNILGFLSILFLFLIGGCNKNYSISQKEAMLLIQPYHELKLPLESIKNLNDIVTFFDTTYCTNPEIGDKTPWPYIYFDFKSRKMANKANSNTIIIGLDANPCYEGVFDDKMILEIVKEHKNLTIENQYTEVDSIPSFVKKQFLSDGSDPNYKMGAFGNGIWICTLKNTPIEDINPIIYQSLVGFIESCREYSIINFNKSIDDLNATEFAALQSEFIFHLSFHYTDKDDVIQMGIY